MKAISLRTRSEARLGLEVGMEPEMNDNRAWKTKKSKGIWYDGDERKAQIGHGPDRAWTSTLYHILMGQ